MSEILQNNIIWDSITPYNVHETLKKKMLVDGFDLVFDYQKSQGVRLIDALTGESYMDFFSFFGSSPIGINHPKLNTPQFRERIGAVASTNKPSNSDLYTVEMAEFVETFSRIAVPDHFKYLFFIDGGALAVENGLKVAFDWKVRKNFSKGYKKEKGQKVIHFKEAFHGRSGYTLSLTNTDPNKILYFPKFDWPRIINPKITFPLEDHLEDVKKLELQAENEIFAAIKENLDDISLIIIEPIQAEGGDNYFRKEFFLKLREIANENDILLMFDEVQTGIGLTGKMWAYQHYVEPDILSFGKKMQVCGIMVSDRIDEVPENCFHKSSRINSTWGGNLVDMMRSKRNLEIIEEENLVENSRINGKFLLDNLISLQEEYPEFISNARGLGLMCAFDMPSIEKRKEFLNLCYKEKLLILPCGTRSIRFRPVLNISNQELSEGLKIIEKVLYLLR